MLTSVLPTVASSWLEVDLPSKCSISSSRCSIGLKSCDWAVCCSKLNFLSCSWSRSWTILFMWHGVLPCWKHPYPYSSASMLLRMHLIGNSSQLSRGIEPSLLFYQGSKCVPKGEKDHTSPCHGLMCGMIDACTHVDFPPHSSLFISLEQQGLGFICISNHLVECFCSFIHHIKLFSCEEWNSV